MRPCDFSTVLCTSALTSLKLLGIELGKDVAKLIMAGRAVLEGPEAAQKTQLFLAEFLDFHPAVGAGKNG